jgi:L-methionine (R)-S-oxide reductase
LIDKAKQEKYDDITHQLEMIWGETDVQVSRMAMVSALLFRYFEEFFWCGFYLLHGKNLTVGPYMGAPAAVILPRKRGVCWTAVTTKQTVVVANVHEFEGHIRVEGGSNSEISVPLIEKSGEVAGVLHVDHADFDAFDSIDVVALEKIASLLS